MPRHDLPPDFPALAEKYLSGELAGDDLARFERHLRETPGAAEYCVTLGFTEALLPEAGERLSKRERPEKRLLRFPLAGLAATAAIVVVAATGYRVASRWKTPDVAEDGRIPARITQAMGVRWKRGATRVGDRLAEASGKFDAGLLELTLDSGVRLLIEGPAEYAVTGSNACRLLRGKAVVDVPVPAQGFVLQSARERIVDHGTRFAVDMRPDGLIGTLGVLSGVVDIDRGDGPLRLFTDYAVERHGDSFDSVVFRKEKFYREMPAREFTWDLPAGDAGTKTLRFDVTPLIHGPGEFRTVLKWLSGDATPRIARFTLRRDGEVVATRETDGRLGDNPVERDNFTLLRVTPETWTANAKWTVETEIASDRPVPAMTGVMHFAEGLAVAATEKDFIGAWRYTHDGVDYRREIFPGGKMRLVRTYPGSSAKPYVKDGVWEVKDGLLVIRFDRTIVEYHMLQEDGSLVFLNRNYRNAHRTQGK